MWGGASAGDRPFPRAHLTMLPPSAASRHSALPAQVDKHSTPQEIRGEVVLQGGAYEGSSALPASP